MTSEPSAQRLKQDIVKQALKTLAWKKLEEHLATINIDEACLDELLAHIRRCTDFIIKRPNLTREHDRIHFIDKLAKFLRQTVGSDAAVRLTQEISLIQLIEAGYSEIMRTLDRTVAAKMLPETQAAAALSRSAYQYRELTKAVQSSVKIRGELTLQSLRIKGEDGASYSPDGILASLVNVTTMTLLLLGHRNNWFDADRFLVLPNLLAPTKDEIYKAGITEVLAASWRNWERMEQRCRYFNGEIRVLSENNLPHWAPKGAEAVFEYDHITNVEYFDYLANERLNDRLIQTYQEMLLQTSVEARSSGIGGPLDLPPGYFVSPQEVHSAVSLCEILGYSIVDDHARPCGLRLVEWVRGYATLQCLADERYLNNSTSDLYFTIHHNELRNVLERVGLQEGTADIFINQASLKMSSRDLFDQPLIRIADNTLLVFAPAILNSIPARVTLSTIGNQGEQLARKGKAFEEEMLNFFEQQGLSAKSFKFIRNGEEFEYDVVVLWDDYIFIFECKNRMISGHNTTAAYYFSLEIKSFIDQVIRLAGALHQFPDAVRERTGFDVTNKTIVPCIVNSLPYALKGDRKGVYVTDASSLKRFFEDRHFHIIRPHNLTRNAKILHRTAIKSLWATDKPTPDDLIAYLSDPIQLQLMIEHTRTRQHTFTLGEKSVATVTDLTRDEISVSSIAKLFSVDEKWVRQEELVVTQAIRKAKVKYEKISVKKADRAWRDQQRKTPPKGH